MRLPSVSPSGCLTRHGRYEDTSWPPSIRRGYALDTRLIDAGGPAVVAGSWLRSLLVW